MEAKGCFLSVVHGRVFSSGNKFFSSRVPFESGALLKALKFKRRLLKHIGKLEVLERTFDF